MCPAHTALGETCVCKEGSSSLAGSRFGAGDDKKCLKFVHHWILDFIFHWGAGSINTVTTFPLYQKAPRPVAIYFQELVAGARAYDLNFLCKYCT